MCGAESATLSHTLTRNGCPILAFTASESWISVSATLTRISHCDHNAHEISKSHVQSAPEQTQKLTQTMMLTHHQPRKAPKHQASSIKQPKKWAALSVPWSRLVLEEGQGCLANFCEVSPQAIQRKQEANHYTRSLRSTASLEFHGFYLMQGFANDAKHVVLSKCFMACTLFRVLGPLLLVAPGWPG